MDDYVIILEKRWPSEAFCVTVRTRELDVFAMGISNIRCLNRVSQSRGRAVAVAMAALMLAVLLLPAMSLLGSDSQGYSGESHTVVYRPWDVDQNGDPAYTISINTQYNAYTDPKLIQTVIYHGNAIAEYNPQFWNKGSFVGDFQGTLAQWYTINSYSVNNTVVFTGWKDLGGNIIDPGDDISDCQKDGDGNIVLTATWGYVDKLGYLSGRGSDFDFKGNDKYKSILIISGDSYFTNRDSPDIGNCTIRSQNGSAVDFYFRDYWFNGTAPFDRFTGPVIIDNVELTGRGETTQTDETGIYMEGHQLIVGTNVTCSGNVQFYGGYYSGNSNLASTDMRFFSGKYSNIIGGGGDNYSVEITSTNLGLFGNDTSVIEMLLGGSVDGKVGTTNILVSGANVNVVPVTDSNLPAGMSAILGGSRTGDVGTSNVTVTGDSHVSVVQGGGRQASSFTKTTNVTISGKAEVIMACGSVTDANPNAGSRAPVETSHVIVTDSAHVSNVYGGGWDVYENPEGASTDATNVVISGGTVDNVYGGGFRGSVGSVTISVIGGEVGNVYGGGKGGKDPFSLNINNPAPGRFDSTGKAYVNGNVSITISSGATISGSVYGGGRGVANTGGGHDDVASVYGSITITLDGAHIGGSVYGGGEGLPGSSNADVAMVTGSVRLNVTNGTDIKGDLYGGGCYGALDPNGGSPGDVEVDISDSTIHGSVYGGGLGETGRMATDIGTRVLVIINGTVGGSVYGGSRDGDDNCESTGSGAVSVRSGSHHAYIYIVSADIADGTSGNVYGGGYRGHSAMDTHIYIGAPAAEATNSSPGGIIKIKSVYGGSSIGAVEGDLLNAVLLYGDSEIEVGSSGYSDFALTGDVFGAGDFCNISGKSEVTFMDFSQESKMLSIQKIDVLNIVRSEIDLDGNMDGLSTSQSPMYSINRIGQINMVGAGGAEAGSRLILEAAAGSISGYASTYESNPITEANYNVLGINSGMIFSILGEGNNGQDMGTITGATLLESDSNDYYGALVMGARSALLDDPSFWVRGDDGYVQTRTADYDYGDLGVRVWYIEGAYKVSQTAIFESQGSDGQLTNSVSVSIPKVNTGSTVSYAGHYVNPDSPDSLSVVGSGDLLNLGKDLSVVFGTGSGNGFTYFGDVIKDESGDESKDRYTGADLASQTGNLAAAKNGGAGLRIDLVMLDGFSTTGYLGTVTIHFVEISGGLVISIFDVEIKVYLRLAEAESDVKIHHDIVMTDDSGWSGTTDVYLPFLKDGAIGQYTISSVTGSGDLSITTVPTNLNRDGWVSSAYRYSPLDLSLPLSGSKLLGTGGVFSPVLRLDYTGSPGDDGTFDDVTMEIVLIGETGRKTIHVILNPIQVTSVDVTFTDKVLSLTSGSNVHWTEGTELFTISIEFGTPVSEYFVAVHPDLWKYKYEGCPTTVEYTQQYLDAVEDLLYNYKEDGTVAVSKDKGHLQKMAPEYEVMHVQELLDKIIEYKPGTAYNDGTEAGNFVFEYSGNYPEWYDSPDGYSRFNFGSEVTEDIKVYAGYSVSISIELYPGSPGSVNQSILFPGAPGTPVDLTGSVSAQAGYTIVGWYIKSDEKYIKMDPKSFRTYTSTTVYVKTEAVEYDLTVSFSGVEVAPTWTLAGGTGADTYNTGQKLTLTVTLPDGYHIGSVSANGGTWNSFSTADKVDEGVTYGTISFTAPAMDLEITVVLDNSVYITVEMPDGGDHDDNDLFGFDVYGSIVKDGDAGSISYRVQGGAVTIQAPTYPDHTVVLSLYSADGAPLQIHQGSIMISTEGIAADTTYVLYVNVEWKVTYGSNYTAAVTSYNPDGSSSGMSHTGYVHTGDIIRLTPGSGYVFGNGFQATGAALRSESGNVRDYMVNSQLTQKTDVVFGDATQSQFSLSVTITGVSSAPSWTLEGGSGNSYAVGQSLRIVVDLTGGYSIKSVTANGGDWSGFTVSGGSISFTGPTMDLDFTIVMSRSVTVQLAPTGGYHDSGLFHMDGSSVVAGTGSSQAAVDVSEDQGITIAAPAYGSNPTVISVAVAGVLVGTHQSSVTVGFDQIPESMVLTVYVNVVWKVTYGSGYTATLTETHDPLGNKSEVSQMSASTAYTGDVIVLTPADGHQFGSGFTVKGAVLDRTEDDGSRRYVVNGGPGQRSDVVFGDAEQRKFTVTVEVTFSVNGHLPTEAPNGKVTVSPGTVNLQPVNEDWSDGTMLFTFEVEVGKYTVTAEFLGYSCDSIEVDAEENDTVSLKAMAVPQTVSFQSGEETVHEYKGWYVGDDTTVSDMLRGSEVESLYIGWADKAHNKLLDSSSTLDIGMFDSGCLVLDGIPKLMDDSKTTETQLIYIKNTQLDSDGYTLHVGAGYTVREIISDLRVSADLDKEGNITLKSTDISGSGMFTVALENDDTVLFLHVIVKGSVVNAGRGSS